MVCYICSPSVYVLCRHLKYEFFNFSFLDWKVANLYNHETDCSKYTLNAINMLPPVNRPPAVDMGLKSAKNYLFENTGFRKTLSRARHSPSRVPFPCHSRATSRFLIKIIGKSNNSLLHWVLGFSSKCRSDRQVMVQNNLILIKTQ